VSSKVECSTPRGEEEEEEEGQSQEHENENENEMRQVELRQVLTKAVTTSEVRFQVPSFGPDTIQVHTERKGGITMAYKHSLYSARKQVLKYKEST